MSIGRRLRTCHVASTRHQAREGSDIACRYSRSSNDSWEINAVQPNQFGGIDPACKSPSVCTHSRFTRGILRSIVNKFSAIAMRSTLGSSVPDGWALSPVCSFPNRVPEVILGQAFPFLNALPGAVEQGLKSRRTAQHESLQIVVIVRNQQHRDGLAVACDH
jgi:hypothetical protein